ncbi:MAG: tyrosine-type recombinase/integrase [Pseudomonadota bacterium]
MSRESVAKLVQLPKAASKIEKDTIFLVLLIGATGLRVSELCSIKLLDVSDDGGSIHVHGKGAKDRIVYVGNCELSAKLREIKTERRQVDAIDALLFLNKRGKGLAPQTVRRRLHKIVRSRGFDAAITPHSMRHTAATMLLEQGTDIRFVQRQLGHSSISTTELYTHVTDIALQRAIASADPMAEFVS